MRKDLFLIAQLFIMVENTPVSVSSQEEMSTNYCFSSISPAQQRIYYHHDPLPRVPYRAGASS